MCRLFRTKETDENRLSSHFVGLCLACAGCSGQRRPTKTGFLLISSDCVWLVPAVPSRGDRRKPAFFSFRRTVFGLCRLFRAEETDENQLFSHFIGLRIACAGCSRQRRPTKTGFLLISSDCAWQETDEKEVFSYRRAVPGKCPLELTGAQQNNP